MKKISENNPETKLVLQNEIIEIYNTLLPVLMEILKKYKGKILNYE